MCVNGRFSKIQLHMHLSFIPYAYLSTLAIKLFKSGAKWL